MYCIIMELLVHLNQLCGVRLCNRERWWLPVLISGWIFHVCGHFYVTVRMFLYDVKRVLPAFALWQALWIM